MAGSTLLLATSNAGKRAEFARLLPSRIQLLTLSNFGIALPPESGATFQAIAAAKALAAAALTGLPTLADDSGLEVDALGGKPGVWTARFAGEHASDAENRAKLLTELAASASNRRTARFRCALALARNGEVVAAAEGTLEGEIAVEERGSQGFGYDPVFLLGDGRTLAELTPLEKDRRSHRGRAMAAISPFLLAMVGATTEGGQ